MYLHFNGTETRDKTDLQSDFEQGLHIANVYAVW